MEIKKKNQPFLLSAASLIKLAAPHNPDHTSPTSHLDESFKTQGVFSVEAKHAF